MVLGGLTKPLRGILQAGKQFLGLRELVGTDSLGTKYYRQFPRLRCSTSSI